MYGDVHLVIGLGVSEIQYMLNLDSVDQRTQFEYLEKTILTKEPTPFALSASDSSRAICVWT